MRARPLLVALLLLAPTLHAQADPPPNVLLLIADDASIRSLGFSGGRGAVTPNLDALAAGGVVMDGAVHMGAFSGAVCTVSRAMILTGRTVWNVTAGRPTYSATAQLDTPDALLPELFGDRGWQTFATGKWHNGEAALRRGFDHAEAISLGGMLPYNDRSHGGVPDATIEDGQRNPQLARIDPRTGELEHSRGEGWSTDVYFDATEAFLRQTRDPERPFFVWLATNAPHDPRHAPAEQLARIDRNALPLPPNLAAEPTRNTGDLRVRDELVYPPPRDEALHRREFASYLAMVAHIDERVGRLLALLDEQGELENTLVLFTSDHGLSMGEHGLMGKQNLDEASWRVPMLLAGPGVPKGMRRAGFVYLHGVGPTLCALSGIDAPPHARSAGFAALVRGETGAGTGAETGVGEPRAFGVYTNTAGSDRGIRCVREGPWKLVRYLHTGEQQLFDLADDPWELDDRSQDPAQAETLARLSAMLQGWMDGSGDPQAQVGGRW